MCCCSRWIGYQSCESEENDRGYPVNTPFRELLEILKGKVLIKIVAAGYSIISDWLNVIVHRKWWIKQVFPNTQSIKWNEIWTNNKKFNNGYTKMWAV